MGVSPILPAFAGSVRCAFARATMGVAIMLASVAAVRAADTPPSSPSQTQEKRVDIDAYDVDGNTKLDQETVEAAVYPFLGPQRTRTDVEDARAALERAYQERGFQTVVVEIPPQNVTDGIVKLHVVEAPIGRLRVVGSHYYLPSAIKDQVPALAEGQVPNLQEAQQQINDLNHLADRRVTPTLKPGIVPGTIDADLHVSDSLPLHASAEINNDHSANTDPLRAVATVHYDNLWQMGQSFAFTFLRAPQNVHSGQVFSGSYLAPIMGSPWNILTYGYQSNSDVNTLGGTNVLGNGYTVGLRGVLQLPSFDDYTQSFNFGADFKHFLESVTLGTGGSLATIDYVPVTAAYNLQRVAKDSETDVAATVVAGVRGIGSTPASFDNNRAFATGSFTHLSLDVSRTQNFGDDIVGYVHLTGQIADQPLLSSEQFAAGGLTSVRGYLQSEAIGDDGFVESAELRSPSIARYTSSILDMSSIVDDWRLFGFFDMAKVWTIGVLPGQTGAFTLESFGAGMRVQALGHFSGNVDVALPLISGSATPARKPRVSFSVKTEL